MIRHEAFAAGNVHSIEHDPMTSENILDGFSVFEQLVGHDFTTMIGVHLIVIRSFH